MHCEKCGRVLNRATGKCVCDSLAPPAAAPSPATGRQPGPPAGGPAPVPLAPSQVPPSPNGRTQSPASPPRPVAPPASPPPPPPRPPVSQAPTPLPSATRVMDAPVPPVPQPPKSSSAPTAFVGAATGRVPWHRSHDIFVFRDRIILTKVGRQSYVPSSTRKRLAQDSRLTAGMLAMRKKARVLHLSAVNDVDVWRKPTGGRATFMLSNGSHVDFDWLSLRNTRDPEDLINKVLSDRVDRVEPSISAFVGGVVARLAFAVAVLAAFVAAAVGGAFGVSALLDDGPPAPPPPPPPTTLPANVQTARAELAKVCPGWLAFENRRGLGDRPAPGELKPVIDGMRGPFDAAAAADASYVVARDQVAWLQDYAGRPDDVAVREAAARVRFALNSVDAACRGL